MTGCPARATVFGPFRLTDRSGQDLVLGGRRAMMLIAMLALEPGGAMERDHLARLLWPGRFKAQASASLRQTLLELGKALQAAGLPPLVVSRTRVSLEGWQLASDLTRLESALDAGDVDLACDGLARCATLPLLDGADLGEAFEGWRAHHRLRVEGVLQDAVARLSQRLGSLGRTADQARLAQAWAARQGLASPPLAGPAVAGNRARIAILPFDVLGGAEAQHYFADGLADELITALSRVPELQVAGRTSSFHFRSSTAGAVAIAEALGVSHLVEGVAQRQGEQVRVNVRLIDGRSGFEVWSGRYQGMLDDVFALQEQVAQAVVAELGAALGIAAARPNVPSLTRSKAAFDLYLQGRSLSAKLFGEGIIQSAIQCLTDAVTHDPDFAEAWTALAEAYQLMSVYTPCLDRIAAAQQMAECARRAIAIAPGQGYAYSLLGIQAWLQRDVAGAIGLAEKAYRLEPNNPNVAMRLGSFLLYAGLTRQAMPYIQAALELDPVDGRKVTLACVAHFNLGELDAARAAGQRMVDLGFPSMWLGVIEAAAGERAQAVETYRATRLLMNVVMFPPAGSAPMAPEVMDAFWLVAAKGVCSGDEADRQHYAQVLEMLYATLHDNADASIVLPAIFMGLPDLLFKTIGRHLSPANMLCLISLWADVDPIRQILRHPEFIPFAQRIGLVEAWDQYGWPEVVKRPTNRIAEPASAGQSN